MSVLFDDVSRIIASPISRREAVKRVGGLLTGALFASFRADSAFAHPSASSLTCKKDQFICGVGKGATCCAKGQICCTDAANGKAYCCIPGLSCCRGTCCQLDAKLAGVPIAAVAAGSAVSRTGSPGGTSTATGTSTSGGGTTATAALTCGRGSFTCGTGLGATCCNMGQVCCRDAPGGKAYCCNGGYSCCSGVCCNTSAHETCCVGPSVTSFVCCAAGDVCCGGKCCKAGPSASSPCYQAKC
jgi:hypothetical protein